MREEGREGEKGGRKEGRRERREGKERMGEEGGREMEEGKTETREGVKIFSLPSIPSSLLPSLISLPPSLGEKKEGEREGRGSVGRKGGGEEGEKMIEKGGEEGR